MNERVTVPPEFLQALAELLAARVSEEVAAAVREALPAPTDAEPWRLLNLEETSARLGRSPRWVRERAKRGDLAYVRLDGGALGFDLVDVQEFARSRRIAPTKGKRT